MMATIVVYGMERREGEIEMMDHAPFAYGKRLDDQMALRNATLSRGSRPLLLTIEVHRARGAV